MEFGFPFLIVPAKNYSYWAFMPQISQIVSVGYCFPFAIRIVDFEEFSDYVHVSPIYTLSAGVPSG
jgi:hypothetical protein